MRLVTTGLAALAALGLLAVGLPQIWYPMWFDQGAFAACGDVLRRGGVFLRDCWDVRGPLTPALYALATALSPTQPAVFAFNLAWQAAAAILLGVLAWRMFGSCLSGIVAGALLWLTMATLNYWSVAQAEGFANLCFIAATLCAWEASRHIDRRQARWLFAGGAFAGALFWFKYPFALYAIVLMAWALARHRHIGAAASVGAGAALAIGLGGVYFLAHGALDDLLLHLRYAIANFHNKPLDERWDWLTGLFWVEVTTFVQIGSTPTAGFKDTVSQVQWLGRGYPFIMLLVALGAVRSLWNSARREAGGLAILWLLTTVLLNVWQGHSYRYHFIIWLPPMALLTGAALADLRAANPIARLAALALFIAAVAGQVLTMWPWMRDAHDNVFVQGKSPRALHLESKEAAQLLLAEFLRDNAAPEDRVIVFSDTPVVYFLAQRKNATRFPYLRWADESRDASVRSALAEAYLSDLTRNLPRFFVLSRDGFPWESAHFIETWKRMPEVHRFIEENYEFIGENGPYILFRRR
ncbi:MAG: hypothetical protein RMN52_03900 [Anaerolineae bacterium]|nr:glycosyltransferase family 39 protein [Candidatus Roseilinea sp.]MDW8449125.1 hypothetical protein [Anaerolineae bacterium]